MSGLIYKNLFLQKFVLIFLSLLSLGGACVIIVTNAVAAGGPGFDEELVGIVTVIDVFVYYLLFYFLSMMSGDLFSQDEKRVMSAFAIATPLGAKGFIESKYYTELIKYTVLLFLCFITDVICMGITGGLVSCSYALVLIYSLRIFLSAFTFPCIVRFGGEKGVQINFIGAIVVILLISVYFLFGDLSFFDDEEPLKKLIETLTSGDLMLLIGAFPFIAFLCYYLSCRVSLKLYRKGAQNYE